MDKVSGQLGIYDQNQFAEYATLSFDSGIDLVTVGRQDRMNLFMSSANQHYTLYDNARRRIAGSGDFPGTPLQAFGSVDGETAFVMMGDVPQLALVDLESGDLEYLSATLNGAGAFAVGLSNNVCH